jgi:hypothetical protein
MIYCRIDLNKTNYRELENYKLLCAKDFESITEIYKTYCKYKDFQSVVPIFYEEIASSISEVIGYYDKDKLVAFSLLNLYPSLKTVCAEQFAWNYESPCLRLGYRSLENECARYKRLGYRYLYLGEYDDYKSQFDGFEIVGKLDE